MVEVDIGAANLGRDGLEHRAARLRFRSGELAPLERAPGPRHDDRFDFFHHFSGCGCRSDSKRPIETLIADPKSEYQGHAIF